MRKFINRYDSIRGWVMKQPLFANRRRKFLINFLSPLNSNNELNFQNRLKLSLSASSNFLFAGLKWTFIAIFFIYVIPTHYEYFFQSLAIYLPILSLGMILFSLFILYAVLFHKISNGYLAQKWNIFIFFRQLY